MVRWCGAGGGCANANGRDRMSIDNPGLIGSFTRARRPDTRAPLVVDDRGRPGMAASLQQACWLAVRLIPNGAIALIAPSGLALCACGLCWVRGGSSWLRVGCTHRALASSWLGSPGHASSFEQREGDGFPTSASGQSTVQRPRRSIPGTQRDRKRASFSFCIDGTWRASQSRTREGSGVHAPEQQAARRRVGLQRKAPKKARRCVV